jgi:hypothetical protein
MVWTDFIWLNVVDRGGGGSYESGNGVSGSLNVGEDVACLATGDFSSRARLLGYWIIVYDS